MGFTLRAALGALPRGARLTVSELVPEIIDWARGPMAALAAGCLDDPRVTLVARDVAAMIAEGRADYDAILLDVDNGPDGLTRDANDRLYSMQGLAAARAALKPGGVLAVWSAAPDDAFARRLRKAGLRGGGDRRPRPQQRQGPPPRHLVRHARLIASAALSAGSRRRSEHS
jgi:spermidine synthase